MTKTVLVADSSGLFGGQAAKAFAAAGWTVRKYQRGTDMAQAAMAADLIGSPAPAHVKRFTPTCPT